MPRIIVPAVALSLVLGACASPAESGPTSTADSTSPTTALASPDSTVPQEDATTTSQPEATDTTSQPEATDTTSDRPLAPDFTLELGDGGTYTLSDGERPVYLVFWAEW